jgi:hypothetical protein
MGEDKINKMTNDELYAFLDGKHWAMKLYNKESMDKWMRTHKRSLKKSDVMMTLLHLSSFVYRDKKLKIYFMKGVETCLNIKLRG